jgi:hypothetical protein
MHDKSTEPREPIAPLNPPAEPLPAQPGISGAEDFARQPAGKPKKTPAKQAASGFKPPPWIKTIQDKALRSDRALAEIRMTLDRQNLRSWTMFPEPLRQQIRQALEQGFANEVRVYRLARGLNIMSPCTDERLVRILAHIFFFEALATWAETVP